jgi:hypothetical protein
MDISFLCPIAAGAGMSPIQAAAHTGLTAVIVGAGAVLFGFGVRAYRRTTPRTARSAAAETVNPRPEPGVRAAERLARR